MKSHWHFIVLTIEDAMTTNQSHWEKVYQTRNYDAVSWYAPHLSESLRLIGKLCPRKDSAIVDIGGGESTLVDDLLAQGYADLSVLDISSAAIDFTKKRLGANASNVNWCVGDITEYDFKGKTFDLWHDRAVFHFLTDADKRAAYTNLVKASVKQGGYVVMATFGPEGPLKCSGLDVVRYDERKLHGEFGDKFRLMGSQTNQHATPSGATQQFLYCWCKVA